MFKYSTLRDYRGILPQYSPPNPTPLAGLSLPKISEHKISIYQPTNTLCSQSLTNTYLTCTLNYLRRSDWVLNLPLTGHHPVLYITKYLKSIVIVLRIVKEYGRDYYGLRPKSIERWLRTVRLHCRGESPYNPLSVKNCKVC